VKDLLPDKTFAETFCFPLLRDAQNEDGGWGFHARAESRVEPTCWAIKALSSRELGEKKSGAVERGVNFLSAAQLADGSWPSTSTEKTGCWLTSLACWVLAGTGDKEVAKHIGAGLRWICQDWPRDSSWWQRTLRGLSSAKRHSRQNDSLRGWGWTPGTSSWVEPTAFALLALEAHAAELSGVAEQRRKLGEAMLYDRMCPGGGWNCGNPEVYGVAGEPLVIPTTWALLALRRHAERREIVESVAWMEKNFRKIQGPGSYAAARICLGMYGRTLNGNSAAADEYHAKNESLRSVQVAAWIMLAASDSRHWVGKGAKGS
jgi:Squalene-hopene cyclase C-terminal domain